MKPCIYPFILFVFINLAGCSFHYYDKKTETEHIFGFGHMSMKLSKPEENVRAAVKGLGIVGFGLSHADGEFSIICGWQNKTRLEVIDEDTSVSLKWPNNDFFNVRVGSEPPFLKNAKVNENFIKNRKGGQ